MPSSSEEIEREWILIIRLVRNAEWKAHYSVSQGTKLEWISFSLIVHLIMPARCLTSVLYPSMSYVQIVHVEHSLLSRSLAHKSCQIQLRFCSDGAEAEVRPNERPGPLRPPARPRHHRSLFGLIWQTPLV